MCYVAVCNFVTGLSSKKSKLIPFCQRLLRVSQAILNFKVLKSESVALITSELGFQSIYFRIKH